jgi:NAD(P)H-dependent flavin oxidoreductase YrpB (nitropropane dioxygenase family)
VKVYLATDGDFYNQPIVADAASALEQAGVDVIAASGFEAGGHRDPFCNRPKIL